MLLAFWAFFLLLGRIFQMLVVMSLASASLCSPDHYFSCKYQQRTMQTQYKKRKKGKKRGKKERKRKKGEKKERKKKERRKKKGK